MTTIHAHFDGHAFIPDEPVNVPLNQQVTLHIDAPVSPAESITGEEIAKSGFAGLWEDRTDIGDTLEFARELRRRAEIRGGSRAIITDTDIVIDILRRYPPAMQWIATVRDPVCLPGYVAFELFQGCFNKSQTEALRKQIAPFAIVWPAESACIDALRVYETAHLAHALGILDTLIGATALYYRVALHTFNVKHFAAFSNLRTIQHYIR